MFGKFFGARAASRTPVAGIPAGERIYAIGDIHGRIDLLDDLLVRIDADEAARGVAATSLIFLGDVVDRGPASAAVIDRLIQVAATRPSVRFLMGNHEEIFLAVLAGEDKALRQFCRIGGRETVMSYGMDAKEYDAADYDELATRMAELVPSGHRDFLAKFENMIEVGDYLFVHAGIRPGTSLAEQRTTDLRWIRTPFLDHRGPLEKRVVHGHTIVEKVEFRPYRIAIDTGAYATGCLTALGLQDRDSWLLQTS